MSKRKGVSAEEKRTRLLDLFHEKKEFFQLKELEKIAPKEKGIIAQSVKDVLQSLVDDGLVDSEKVGTSVYFWSYPNKTTSAKKRKVDTLTSKIEECKKKLKETAESIEEAQKGREPTEERSQLLEEWKEKKAEMELLKEKIKKYDVGNPEYYEKMKEHTEVAKLAVNRWTDNIFALRSWCKNKFCIEGSVFDKQFEIDPEMDYIE